MFVLLRQEPHLLVELLLLLPGGGLFLQGDGAARASQVSGCRCSIDQASPDYQNEKMKGGLMGQRHRRLVAASCCIWLLTVVALVSCQNAPDVAGLRSLATEGDTAAQYNLGEKYADGDGVPQDAADQGHGAAQYSLGWMYANGEGVPQDDAEAVRWYRLAADQGHASAQHSLGFMYYTGRGVPQDYGEAADWYRLAADQGNDKAQGNLGLLYLSGRGVPQDDGEAVRWYRLAADQGHASAQHSLGLMYAAGRGVPQDYVAANMWAHLAADQGYEPARDWLDVLAEAISAAERPAIVPEPDWTAHTYTVVREEDISSSIRMRRRLWIVAPAAQTPEARIATLIEAAIHVQHQSYPQFLSAFLLPFDTAEDAMAKISYAPDGCGVSGSDCTGEMWTDAAASDGVVTATQEVIRKDWDANRDRFKDADGLVEEPRLYQFLADKHSMTTEAVRAEMLGFAEATLGGMLTGKMELPDDVRTKGELTEEEKAQSEEIACRFDLQCWGDKHNLRAARPCQLAIENLALYDYEWTDGWLGAKFARFAWKDREAGTIAHRGSEIKFQNAFGAWRRSSYWCDYDPNTQTVLDARVF